MTTPDITPPHPDEVDPSDPETLVASSIYWYPMLVENRTDVLEHLLLVAGNGYTWDRHGRLVSCFRDLPRDRDADRALLDPLRAGAGPEEAAEYEAELARLTTIRNEFAARATARGPVTVAGVWETNFGSGKPISALPDEVHPAWQALVAETVAVFGEAWQVQADAENARWAELDTDRVGNAARMAHQRVDSAYELASISRAEHRAARALLTRHTPPPLPETGDLDAAHTDAQHSARRLRKLWAEVSGDDIVEAPTPRDRTAAEVVVTVVESYLTTVRHGARREPVPNLTHTDLVWLARVVPDLV